MLDTSSSQEVQKQLERYYAAPLCIDVEYMRHYTEAHRRTDGYHVLERRAECHAHALENLTPCIFPEESIVGRKTRFVRGAVPLCQYASGYIVRELNKQVQEAQDNVTELGTGGGFANSRAEVEKGHFVQFGKSFIIPQEDVPVLRGCAEYFQGKCMQDVGDRLWKTSFEEADYITKGWQAVLYTAPHDPCPEGRIALDFERGLGVGLEALAEDMRGRIRAENVSDVRSAEKVYFWRAAIRSIEGVLHWCASYARKAREMAAAAEDDATRERFNTIAACIEHSPAKPPRNFREALQAWWLLYISGHMEGAHLGYSPGRFDRYMYPYYKMSIEHGDITPNQALHLLEEVRVKMTEIAYIASFSWEGVGSGNLFQNMIIGGTDERGLRGDNELSLLVLQAAINCRTIQPTLSVWYDGSLSDAFLLKAAECVKTGCGFPAFFNLKVYLQHELERTHLPLALLRKYAAMGGCTEPTIEGHSYGVVQAGFVNHAKVLELAMYGGVDPRTGLKFRETPLPQTPEELRQCYLVHLADAVSYWQRYWNYCMAAHRQTCSLLFCSVLVRDCIGRGLCMDDGGAVNNCTPTTLSSGLVNVVNALAAVQAVVPARYTMDALRAACRANWEVEGGAQMRQALLRAPKWGNNLDAADQVYVDLYERYCEIVSRQKNFLGEPYDPSMLAISTHLPFGKACLATPDGRVAGEQLSDGVTSPFPGTDTEGPLAVLLSAAKIDHTRIRGGLHNMKFHPSALEGVAGSRKLLTLIRTYFQSNGFQIQFNVVDSRMLRDAQEHPEAYRSLIVRVAGFSAFFVELAKPVQDEVIRRTEQHFEGETDADAPLPPSAPAAAAPAAVAVAAPAEAPAACQCPHAARGGKPSTLVFDIEEFAVRDGPGVRTTVFVKGCPLRCKWCCNPEGQTYVPEVLHAEAKCAHCGACARACPFGAIRVAAGEYTMDRSKCAQCTERPCIAACPHQALRLAGKCMTAEEVSARLATTHAFTSEGGGVTLSGGEALSAPHLPFVRDLVARCAAKGMSVAVETSGAWTRGAGPDAVDDALLRSFDLFYFDLKHADPARHRDFIGQDNANILANFRHVASLAADRVVVSVPVVPTFNDSAEVITAIAGVARAAGVAKMRLLPYHRMGEGKYADLERPYPMAGAPTAVPADRMAALRAAAVAAGMKLVE